MLQRIKSSYRFNKSLKFIKLQQSWFNKRLYQYKIKDITKLSFPDFMIIGTAKSGTWWLAKALEEHPEVKFGYGKETGEIKYFDKQFHESLEFYSSHFPTDTKAKIGEKTPGYCNIPKDRIKLIKALNPGMKLIILLRNPIDRLWSDALMINVRRPGKNIEEVKDEAFYNHFNNNRINYIAIIENWLKYFNKEQLLICFYDEIQERPKELLKKVFSHIGVSLQPIESSNDLNQVVNKGPGIQMPERFKIYLQEMYYNEIEHLYEMFGEPVEKWRIGKSIEQSNITGATITNSLQK